MWMCSMCLIHENDAFKDLKAQHISVIVSVGGGVKKRIPGLFVPVKARRQDVAEVLMVTMEMRAQRRRGQSDSSPLTTTSVCVCTFFLIRGGVSPLFPFFKHTFVFTKKLERFSGDLDQERVGETRDQRRENWGKNCCFFQGFSASR